MEAQRIAFVAGNQRDIVAASILVRCWIKARCEIVFVDEAYRSPTPDGNDTVSQITCSIGTDAICPC